MMGMMARTFSSEGENPLLTNGWRAMLLLRILVAVAVVFNLWTMYRRAQVREFFGLADAGPSEAAVALVQAQPWLAGRTLVMKSQGPRSIAVETGQTGLHFAARRGDAPLCQALVDAGADYDASDANRSTPLLEAVQAGKLPAAEVLVAAGADPDLGDRHGTAPLDLAKKDPALRKLLTAGHPHPAGKPPWSVLAHQTAVNCTLLAVICFVGYLSLGQDQRR